MTSPIKIIHLTDSHLFADKTAALRKIVTYDSLMSVISHINGSDWNADCILATGDLTHDYSRQSYEHFCHLLGSLDTPVLCVPGNHDHRQIMQTVLAKFSFPYCQSREYDSWLIAGIDSCEEEKTGGKISNDEMLRLENLLKKYKSKNILIGLHHPPIDIGSQWLDSVGLSNQEKFFSLIRKFQNVKGIIFGHAHQKFNKIVNNINILGTPSTCRQFKRKSDNFAVDDNPPAYRRVYLQPNGEIHSELIWISR